ncbi:MAG: YkvA family protein [Limisphaerales bacterium]
MSEFAAYVNHGAAKVTPAMVVRVSRQLPSWKLEFTQIAAPKYPHLVDQLEFLADAVEDFAEGAYRDLPLYAAAQAVFALTYAHKKIDIIPDAIPDSGRADDSSVVRAVLIQNERAFAAYAEWSGLDWQKITSEP